MRAGLPDGFVPVNAADAWLHNIEDKAYVVAPACFEAFAAGRAFAPSPERRLRDGRRVVQGRVRTTGLWDNQKCVLVFAAALRRLRSQAAEETA